MTARDEVAQVAVFLALEKTLVEHPIVVVDLGKIFVAAVADERDDALRRGLLAAIAQRCPEQRAGGCTGNDALFLEQLAAGLERFGIGDRISLLHAREIGYG